MNRIGETGLGLWNVGGKNFKGETETLHEHTPAPGRAGQDQADRARFSHVDSTS